MYKFFKSYNFIFYKVKIFLIFLFFALISFSGLNLSKLDDEITIKHTLINKTPITIFEPKIDNKNNILIFIAHGFAGSSSFMKSIALSLANTGYKTITFDFLGHGRHSKPYSGNIMKETGATKIFVKQTELIIGSFLKKNDNYKAIIIGHSMASDIIFRVANLNDNIIGSIGISNYTDQIKKKQPNNVLIINGIWEKQLRNKALSILESIGIKNPKENVLYGSFRDGSARKSQYIKNSDHVGILYSQNSQLSINEWVNNASGNRYKVITNKLGVYTAILFLSIISLYLIIVSLIKKRNFKKIDVSLLRCLLANILSGIITPLLLFFFSIKFTAYPAHSYLINHLFLYGTLAIIINKIPITLLSIKDFKLSIFTTILCFNTLILGNILDNYVSTFYLTHSRIQLFIPLIFACIPISLLIDSYYINEKFIFIKSTISKVLLIISLSAAIYLNFEELFLLGYAIILLVAFWLVYGFLSHFFIKRLGSFLSISLANGFTIAWTLAVAIPIYIK